MRLSNVQIYNELKKQSLLSSIIGDRPVEQILAIAAERIKELAPEFRENTQKHVDL